MQGEWEIICQHEDPDIVTYQIYEMAEEFGVDLVAIPEFHRSVVKITSGDPMHRVETVLSEVKRLTKEGYERL